MAEIPKIVLPHGGYRKLIIYRKSDVIYQGTVTFCRRFLPAHGDRMVDQMTQDARSCKQNIAEGSAASGTKSIGVDLDQKGDLDREVVDLKKQPRRARSRRTLGRGGV